MASLPKELLGACELSFNTTDDPQPDFYEYTEHLREAADPKGYGLSDEIITSFAQWIEMTYGLDAMREAVAFVTMEWDL